MLHVAEAFTEQNKAHAGTIYDEILKRMELNDYWLCATPIDIRTSLFLSGDNRAKSVFSSALGLLPEEDDWRSQPLRINDFVTYCVDHNRLDLLQRHEQATSDTFSRAFLWRGMAQYYANQNDAIFTRNAFKRARRS